MYHIGNEFIGRERVFMEALTVTQRAAKIFELISNFEHYDGRLDNTENYLLDIDTGSYIPEAGKIIEVIRNRLLKDGLASRSLLWNIIGDEEEGSLIWMHDEWVEAAIERNMQDTLLLGTGFNPITMPMELEQLQAGLASLRYIEEPFALERIFLVPMRSYQKEHGHVVKVVTPEPHRCRYLPSRALKCEALTHEVLRAMTKLGFQGQMQGDSLLT